MKPATLKLEDLAIEPLSELCKEAYEETAWALEKALGKAIKFGRLLCIAKTKVPHGKWISWCAETFEDQVSLRNIQRYMQVAESNTTTPSLLEGAKTLDDAIIRIQVKKIPAAELVSDADSAVAMPVAANEHDQHNCRMMEDTTAAFGTGDGIDVVVEPSISPGYAYLSILIGTECVWLKRPIRRNKIPMLLRGEIPADARLSWEFAENANRVNQALFAIK